MTTTAISGMGVIDYGEAQTIRGRHGAQARRCLDKLKILKETCVGQPTEKLHLDMTFGEWLDFWYQNYPKPRLQSKSQLDYENSIYKHIIPAMGKIQLADLIREMKTEISEAKQLASEGNWDEAMALVGQKKARGARKVVRKEEKCTTL